jgi:DNA helicase II / ATP-dependent DNA helicase PcrA
MPGGLLPSNGNESEIQASGPRHFSPSPQFSHTAESVLFALSRQQFRLASAKSWSDAMAWDEDLDAASPAYGIAASANHRIRVVAGPGAGKSFAMKRRVARLLELDIAAERILPVTFTRVAAEDLHRELVGMDVPGCEDLEGITLHSLAMRILMRGHVLEATGRTPRPLNDFELRPLEADLGRFGGVREIRRLIRAYESAWARLQHDEPGFVQTEEDATFEGALVAWLRFHRATLIGEVIPLLHSFLRLNPAAPERTAFSHILVDEYQDLNRAEQGVIDLLSDNADVCVVGDDDQSIYSFKFAHPEGIREWLDENEGAADLTLLECRRCPTRVVAMANHLIAHNQMRPIPRQLQPRPENGVGDVRIIQYPNIDAEVAGVAVIVDGLTQAGIPSGEILVLAQRGVIGTPIYEALIDRGVPSHSYYAEAELDKEEAQRRFALLKLLVNRDDRVALRWLLGLGSSSWLNGGYARLRSYCEELGGTPWITLERLLADEFAIQHTRPLVTRFAAIRAEILALEDLHDLFAVVDNLFPEGMDEVRDLRARALTALEAVEADDREGLLAAITSAIAAPEVPSEVADVRIMSLHKSKGLSAAVTIIAGCIEGLLPMRPDATRPQAQQDAYSEEQRRLFYVGITRVKARPDMGQPGTLILSYSTEMPIATAMGAGITPASRRYGTARMIASRFLAEMGPQAPQPVAG